MRSTVQGLGSAGYVSTNTNGVLTGTFANVINSTIDGNANLYTRDTGSFFLFSVNAPGYTLTLPSAQSGWNVVLKNLATSGGSLTVTPTVSPLTLTAGQGNTVVSEGTIFYSIY
jgi:hypothetical protein